LDERIARNDVEGFKDFVASEAFRAGHLPETQIGPEQMWSLIRNVASAARVAPYVERTYGRQSFWSPTLMAGDALVFTSMMFHRTQSSAQMSKIRYSLELRGSIKDRSLSIAGVPRNRNEIETLQEAPA
jgi:hypothetical protein